jgi:predicted dehydrogenase
VSDSLDVALELLSLAQKAGIKHGVVQDKLWLPGMLKLKTLMNLGFFGRIFSVRGEFGYWVFEGDTVPIQRPSWNYRKEEGGGIIIDMLCHWRYVLDNLFGPVKAVSCLGATHIPTRWDEAGKPYDCTADDSAYATFDIAGKDGGTVAHFNSSWAVRVRRDDLLTIRWMAPRARQWPACATAGRSTTATPRAPSGTLMWIARSTISKAGRKSRNRTASTTPSSASGNFFSVTW